MRKIRIPVFAGLMLLFVIAFFISCEKEISSIASNDSEIQINDPSVALDVKLAKKYYKILKAKEGDKVINKNTTTLSDDRPNRKYLLFKKAYSSSTSKATLIEVPLFYNKRPSTIMGKKSEFPDQASANKILTTSFDRLIIYKNKKTGKVDQRIVTYIPDKSYLDRHNNDASHNQINKLDPDFSGKLVYKSWDGTPLFAYQISGGKSVKTFSKYRKSSKKKTQNNIMGEICETFFNATYEQQCYSSDPEGYEEVCSDWVLVDYYEWTECYDDGLTGDDCIDFGINCDDNPIPGPEPCQSSTTYSEGGAKVMTECNPNPYPTTLPPELNAFNRDGIRDAIARGVTGSAELAHKMYKQAAEYLQNHPTHIGYINTLIDGARVVAREFTDMNPQTMGFKDLVNIWLFELGTSDKIIFDGNDTSTGQVKAQEGATDARNLALAQVAAGNLSSVKDVWAYGQGEFYDGMVQGNLVTSYIGSYVTNVTITDNHNGSYTLNYSVDNTTGWESGSRLRIDNDHNGVHDGIIPDKLRGAGIHLGGNFRQTWNWSETVRP